METQNKQLEVNEVDKAFKKLPKLKGEIQDLEAYLNLIAEYYELNTSKNVFWSKTGITQYKFDRIEAFMKKYYSKQLEDAVIKRKEYFEQKSNHHLLNLPIVIKQVEDDKIDITRFLNGDLDIELLIELTSKNKAYKKHLKKLHTVRINLKKYKEPFNLKSYLSMNIQIAGIKITQVFVEETLEYMIENSIFVCNYTVQDCIRKKVLEIQKKEEVL